MSHDQALPVAGGDRVVLIETGVRREEIWHIGDSARLHSLHGAAIRCADLESFAKEL